MSRRNTNKLYLRIAERPQSTDESTAVWAPESLGRLRAAYVSWVDILRKGNAECVHLLYHNEPGVERGAADLPTCFRL